MAGEAEARYIKARQEALLERLNARKLDALVVTRPANVFYLTGFRGSAGIALFTARASSLLVDPRYTLQAQDQAVGVEVSEVTDGLLHAAGHSVRKARVKRPAFEDASLTVSEFQALKRAAPAALDWQPAGEAVEELRAVKDPLEVENIRQAGELTAQVFADVERTIRPGVSENDLAAEIEYRMRTRGADGAAFETIVASGPRGALPHARPTGRVLRAKELVIIDLGAILGGYASDMTRTVHLGKPSRRTVALYRAVLEAQMKGIESLKAGVQARSVDGAARHALTKRHLAKFFTHSTGHGVGIEIHERPRLAKSEKKKIPPGSVVTVEPGIYLEGLGGVRIEDTVLVSQNGAEILTPAPKSPWWVE